MGTDARKPLYIKVCDSIRKKIMDGGYAAGDLLPSEREIGEMFEVDRTTVRKALNELVLDKMVEKKAGIGTRVLWAAEALENHYRDNVSISFFLPKASRKNDRITQPFYANLFYNIEMECKKKRFNLLYSTLDESDDFESILSSRTHDGIIFVSNVDRKFIDLALEKGIPSVLVNNRYDPVPCVVPDYYGGTYKISEYLTDLGHSHIAIIEGTYSYFSTSQHAAAYTASFSKKGIKPLYQISDTSYEQYSGYTAARELLEHAGKGLPTVVMCNNDLQALGTLQAIHEFGLRVPEDVSVFGFDNIEQGAHSFPSLSTVDPDMKMISTVTVQLLADQIANEAFRPKMCITIPASLIVRNSVAPAKG